MQIGLDLDSETIWANSVWKRNKKKAENTDNLRCDHNSDIKFI